MCRCAGLTGCPTLTGAPSAGKLAGLVRLSLAATTGSAGKIIMLEWWLFQDLIQMWVLAVQYAREGGLTQPFNPVMVASARCKGID